MTDEFKLKNYTTGIAAEKSIAEIEALLAKFGATTIQKNYMSDGKVTALAFMLGDKGYKLPVNSEGVNKILTKDKRSYHSRDNRVKHEEQAYRTAWRIIKDWLHAQLSIIASGQAQPDQVLLPYQYDGTQTLYERYKNNQLSITGGETQ